MFAYACSSMNSMVSLQFTVNVIAFRTWLTFCVGMDGIYEEFMTITRAFNRERLYGRLFLQF